MSYPEGLEGNHVEAEEHITRAISLSKQRMQITNLAYALNTKAVILTAKDKSLLSLQGSIDLAQKAKMLFTAIKHQTGIGLANLAIAESYKT